MISQRSFLVVKALSSVTFSVKEGEVHALVGENGAGKSTLMNILSGVCEPNSGSISLYGEPVSFKNTKEAQAHGISLIHQEFNLVNSLSVAENIYLGYLQTHRGGWINWKQVRRSASKLLQELGFDFSVRTRVEQLSVAEKQLVEIAKALVCSSQDHWNGRADILVDTEGDCQIVCHHSEPADTRRHGHLHLTQARRSIHDCRFHYSSKRWPDHRHESSFRHESCGTDCKDGWTSRRHELSCETEESYRFGGTRGTGYRMRFVCKGCLLSIA